MHAAALVVVGGRQLQRLWPARINSQPALLGPVPAAVPSRHWAVPCPSRQTSPDSQVPPAPCYCQALLSHPTLMPLSVLG